MFSRCISKYRLIIQSTSVTARFCTKHQRRSPRTMQTPRLMHNKDCTTWIYHSHIQVSSIRHDGGGDVKKNVKKKKKGIRDEASDLSKGGMMGGYWMEPYWERLVSLCVCVCVCACACVYVRRYSRGGGLLMWQMTISSADCKHRTTLRLCKSLVHGQLNNIVRRSRESRDVRKPRWREMHCGCSRWSTSRTREQMKYRDYLLFSAWMLRRVHEKDNVLLQSRKLWITVSVFVYSCVCLCERGSETLIDANMFNRALGKDSLVQDGMPIFRSVGNHVIDSNTNLEHG